MKSHDKLRADFDAAVRNLPEDKAEYLWKLMQIEAARLEAQVLAERAADLLRTIPLFSLRDDARETAIDFFHRHYGAVLATGVVFTDDLRRYDSRLYDALAVYQSARGQRLGHLMPSRNQPLRSGRPRKATTALRQDADVAA